MKKSVILTLLGLVMVLITPRSAFSQNTQSVRVVATCGSPTYIANRVLYMTMDVHGNLCTSASITCDQIKQISVTTNTQLITGTAAKHIYICSISIVVSAATNVAIVSGTGTVCATGIGSAYGGGTTANAGYNFGANSGIAQGTGIGWIGRTAATGDNICILVSAANQTSGTMTYTIQ